MRRGRVRGREDGYEHARVRVKIKERSVHWPLYSNVSLPLDHVFSFTTQLSHFLLEYCCQHTIHHSLPLVQRDRLMRFERKVRIPAPVLFLSAPWLSFRFCPTPQTVCWDD